MHPFFKVKMPEENNYNFRLRAVLRKVMDNSIHWSQWASSIVLLKSTRLSSLILARP